MAGCFFWAVPPPGAPVENGPLGWGAAPLLAWFKRLCLSCTHLGLDGAGCSWKPVVGATSPYYRCPDQRARPQGKSTPRKKHPGAFLSGVLFGVLFLLLGCFLPPGVLFFCHVGCFPKKSTPGKKQKSTSASPGIGPEDLPEDDTDLDATRAYPRGRLLRRRRPWGSAQRALITALAVAPGQPGEPALGGGGGVLF